MTATAISNLVMHKSLMDHMRETRKNVARTQEQISSGRAVETYEELASTGRTEGIINMESKLSQINSYLDNNQIITGRLQATDTSLENIINSLFEFRSVLVKRRSALGSSPEIVTTINQVGKTTLSIMRDNLNLRYDGQYMFAGAKVDVQPVNNIVDQTNILNGEVTSNYYNGDGVTRSTKVSDSLTVNYGVRANEAGFQKAIGAINLTLKAVDDNNLSDAYELLDDAIKDIVNVRNNVRNSMSQIENVSEIFESTRVYFTQSIGEVINTNIPEASVTLANDMARLMGTYQTFSQVSRLNLMDYLK
ncbi:MAG: hypothetical protein J0H68_04075 [Sphingobacteriia bacterium]|nr:hypothetical protein [Sphingobacteriia bacterium]